MLESLKKRLAEKQLGLEVTDSAKEFIVSQGYDVNFGARPLRRFIQQKLETLAARMIIEKDPIPGTVIHVDFNGRELEAK